jgi:hypothetical protein
MTENANLAAPWPTGHASPVQNCRESQRLLSGYETVVYMELLLVGLAQRTENEFTPTGHPPYPVASYVLGLIQARLCSKAS